MEKHDISRTLRQIADRMRRQAGETALPQSQDMMMRAAETLEAEAELVAERQSRDFSHALEGVFARQIAGARFHWELYT